LRQRHLLSRFGGQLPHGAPNFRHGLTGRGDWRIAASSEPCQASHLIENRMPAGQRLVAPDPIHAVIVAARPRRERKRRRVATVVPAARPMVDPVAADRRRTSFQRRELRDKSRVVEQTRGGNTVFATRKNRAVAFVKVDGQLFTVQRSGPPANAVCRKGTPYRERWVGQGTVIYIDQRATRSGAESCWYNGTMRVVVGERSMLTPIGGACGC